LSSPSPSPSPRRAQILFLIRFAVILVAFYFVVALRPVNDSVIVPFTSAIAHAGGSILHAFGEPVRVNGTRIASAGFAIDVENGCNGVETALLLAAAMLAFPASAAAKGAGFAAGFLLIEAVNLVRVATLFWVGAHRPAWFGPAHSLIWQSVVVLIGIGWFVMWASRVGKATSSGGGG
jgi:exosortase H (IPTLxxWG-CTERM-specific)